jgi:protein required for attachment to host cells
MLGLIIPKGTHILVGDGSKALLLVNEGTVPEPDFKVEHVFSQKNPPTREQGTDRPGRAFSSAGYRRAAMADTNWHVFAERDFARDVTTALGALQTETDLKRLIIVAPPKTLAELRKSMPSNLQSHIVAEVAHDLTKHPVKEIARLLTQGQGLTD